MCLLEVRSDQLDTWSDENRKGTCCQLEKAPPNAFAPVTAAQGSPARLAYRALQALRQTGMQVRRRSRPWSQVLSFREPLGLAATDGLCAAGISCPGCGICRQLSPSPRNLGSDLRDQPRTPAPPEGALKGCYGRTLRSPSSDRCWVGRRASRQYGRSLAGWQPGPCDQRGGSQ